MLIPAGYLKLEVFSPRHRQQVGNLLLASGEVLIVRHAHQHMRRLASVGDENRPLIGGPLGFAGRLVEFPA
jgi:hypothetical protein